MGRIGTAGAGCATDGHLVDGAVSGVSDYADGDRAITDWRRIERLGESAIAQGKLAEQCLGKDVMSLEDLCQHWLRSHEEEPDDGLQIYRPASTSLPARRFRLAYQFHSDGRWEWLELAPDCRHYFNTGSWRLEQGATLTPEGTRPQDMLYLSVGSPDPRSGSRRIAGRGISPLAESAEAAYCVEHLSGEQLCLRPIIMAKPSDPPHRSRQRDDGT